MPRTRRTLPKPQAPAVVDPRANHYDTAIKDARSGRVVALRGLADTDKQRFVAKMWSWLDGSEGPECQLTAARILGKGFIGEKVTTERPEPLPLAGIKAGIARMLDQPEESGEVATDDETPLERVN